MAVEISVKPRQYFAYQCQRNAKMYKCIRTYMQNLIKIYQLCPSAGHRFKCQELKYDDGLNVSMSSKSYMLACASINDSNQSHARIQKVLSEGSNFAVFFVCFF